jgi:hypothetical protein
MGGLSELDLNHLYTAEKQLIPKMEAATFSEK